MAICGYFSEHVEVRRYCPRCGKETMHYDSMWHPLTMCSECSKVWRLTRKR